MLYYYCLALIFISQPLLAQEDARNLLDGMSFKGKFVNSPDVLYFNQGQFWSKNCVPCGFKPGEYWVREVGDEIHFKGTLQSDDRGQFHYTGVMRDGQIEATIAWHHKRWYWNIEREFQFIGELALDQAPSTAQHATQNALSAQPDPLDCNPGDS